MEPLKMQSHDVIGSNTLKIAQLFPNCVTERLGKDGKPELAIDFEKLQAELSNEIIGEGEERYQFTWPDKRAAVRLANTPTTMTLRPCREESVDFDNTQNLYIEGDNLDVLKVLRETYLGKVKMIYIDPPYNTGNDFVYNDDFAQGKDTFEQASGLFDEEGNQTIDPMQRNTESNGRFHTDWLNMIYPRLKVARDLLTEDGVMFVSMADNELTNLLKVCEESFGKNNIEIFVWKKKGGAGNTERILGVLTEYIICCFKNKKPGDFNYQEFIREYKYKDNKGPYNLEGIEKTNLGTYERKTMQFAIVDPATDEEFYPTQNMRWTLGETSVKEFIKAGKIFFDYDTGKVKRIKRPEDYEQSKNVYYNLFVDEGSLAIAKDECAELLGNREAFDTPKPLSLLGKLLKIASRRNSIILDFFSGSATTAHAVMKLNAEDGGNRKFIMVQLPEKTDEKSEAYKAGYKNICEIGKERIRRAGKKVKEEAGLQGQNLDTGFRVLKLDSSNMEEVYYTPQEFNMGSLFNENVKADRSNEDLLFQVMLDLGIELSVKIETKQIAGKQVHIVDEGYLVACFDRDVNESTIIEIAKQQPVYFVMRDASAANDNVIDNFEQIFRHYSPDTSCRII
jgi:adenine-specific DNA-methyltransferase